MQAGCGASVSLEISDHWSGMLDLVQRDSQRATGDCGLGDVGFGHFSLESLESSGPGQQEPPPASLQLFGDQECVLAEPAEREDRRPLPGRGKAAPDLKAGIQGPHAQTSFKGPDFLLR